MSIGFPLYTNLVSDVKSSDLTKAQKEKFITSLKNKGLLKP